MVGLSSWVGIVGEYRDRRRANARWSIANQRAPSAPSELSQALPQALTEGSRLMKEGSKANNKADLTAAIGQFEQALKLSQQLLPTASDAQNLARTTAFIGLARSYKALGDPTKALDYYNQAVPILLVMGDRPHAAALRQAQLKQWQQGKAPYYWAAFTLQGEWRN